MLSISELEIFAKRSRRVSFGDVTAHGLGLTEQKRLGTRLVDRDFSTTYCSSSSDHEVDWLRGTICIEIVGCDWCVSILNVHVRSFPSTVRFEAVPSTIGCRVFDGVDLSSLMLFR